MGTATAWAEIDGVAPGLSIAATASFTPTDITDLFMWFDASNAASITSSGSPAKVSQAQCRRPRLAMAMRREVPPAATPISAVSPGIPFVSRTASPIPMRRGTQSRERGIARRSSSSRTPVNARRRAGGRSVARRVARPLHLALRAVQLERGEKVNNATLLYALQ